MNDKLLAIIHKDIERCQNAQSQKEGSFELFQALVGKYNTMFKDFGSSIPSNGKVTTVGSAFNYRPELIAVKEKLEFIIATEAENDSLFSFKKMFQKDLDNLMDAKSDLSNTNTPEKAKQQLYHEVTAKYHTIIPKLGEGLYNYNFACGFYDEVSGESLFYNLNQLFNKLTAFKATDFPTLKTQKDIPQTQLSITNTNQNQNTNRVVVNIEKVIKQVEGITSNNLSEEDRKRITDDLYTLEGIKNSGNKDRFWDKARGIISFVLDKGVDVAIATIPYIIQGLQNI